MSMLPPGALAQIQSSLLSSGSTKEPPLEQLSTDELEALLLIQQERLELTERAAFWGGFGSAFWAVGKALK